MIGFLLRYVVSYNQLYSILNIIISKDKNMENPQNYLRSQINSGLEKSALVYKYALFLF